MEDKFLTKLKELNYPFPISAETLCLENTRLNDKYVIFDLIAVGSHSTIYYGIEQATGQERAFKVYNLKEIQASTSFKEKEMCKRISNYQWQIMRKCNSLHILKCYDIYENRDYKVLVYEYCNMGSLKDELGKRKFKFINEVKAVMIIKHIIAALKDFHAKTHKFQKNITPKNILVKNGVYKIIDFGLPVSFSEVQDNAEFLIPEIIMKKNYDQKAQVWNIGVLFHQILFGQLPYALTQHTTKSYLINSSLRTILKQQSSPYSKNAISFLSACLATNPEQRMTWKQLQTHSLLNLKNEAIKLFCTPTQKGKQKNKYNSRLSLILPIEYSLSIQENKLDVSIYSNKYMLEIQKRQIEKELQIYAKLGQMIQFYKIEAVSWKSLRQQVNTEQYKSYRFLQKYYLQCLKVDFFYHQIIAVINLIPSFLEERMNLQFIFLILSRCFFEISQINMLKQTKFTNQQSIVFFCISKQTERLYQQTKNRWQTFSNQLHKQQSKWLSIISDKYRKISKTEQYQLKQRFITGIEGKDYQKEQQIAFTVKFYQENIESELIKMLSDIIINKKSENESPRQSLISLILKYMPQYDQIWNLSQQQIYYSSFKNFIDKELFKQQ